MTVDQLQVLQLQVPDEQIDPDPLLAACVGCGEIADVETRGAIYCFACLACPLCGSSWCTREDHRL